MSRATAQVHSARALRRRRLRPMVLSLALLMASATGCITNIGPSTTASEKDLGPYPENYEHIIRVWIERTFSGVSRVTSLQAKRPRPGTAKSTFGGQRYGWWTEVTFRSRDRVGASRGSTSYSVLIRDGEVVDHQKLVR